MLITEEVRELKNTLEDLAVKCTINPSIPLEIASELNTIIKKLEHRLHWCKVMEED